MSESTTDDKLLAAALSKLEKIRKSEAFDPVNIDSRPTAPQKEVIDDFGKIPVQWVVAATQSGKSQVCSRVATWVLTETHPSWKRPDSWGSEPLLIIVAGRTGKQLEESLLPKLRSYLEPGSYKEVRIGNIIQRLEHVNGNRIVFQSLENPNVARERIQSYVAHLVWIDEMPPTAFIIDELQRRVQARNGFFLASFTPLVVNDEIRKMVDAAREPYSKKYKFTMLDNPLYQDPERKKSILESMATLPEHVRNTRLYGEWSANDGAVYYFNYDKHVEFPMGYSPMWRHVESVDPAISSALGLTLWAENPATGVWYCVLAEYIKGLLVPTEIVKEVQKYTANKNIIRRTSDYAPWYTNTAYSMGITYHTIDKKNDGRKPELIKQVQELLGTKIKISPTCDKLISEIQEQRWSDTAEGKIVNSSSYHLIDATQYFCDYIPKPEAPVSTMSWENKLYSEHITRLTRIEKGKINMRNKIEAQRTRIQNRSKMRRR